MKRVFLDANVVVDFIDASSRFHTSTVEMIKILRKKEIELFISPTTFVIVNHLLYKFLKNRALANQKLISLSDFFKYANTDQLVMDKVVSSGFNDLEDALQYFSAKSVNANFIITHNNKDFPLNDKTVLNFHYLLGMLKYKD
jgi:predicted nucleic acid-binding protein